MVRSGRVWRGSAIIASALVLIACAVKRPAPPPLPSPAAAPAPAPAPQPQPPAAATLDPPKSRWVAVPWSALPGWEADRIGEAWGALLRNCERPPQAFAPLCPDVRRLAGADEAQQRQWLVQRLQPYRVESHQGQEQGLLTSYFEPVLEARRTSGAGHAVPLYRPPADLGSRKPWFSRQEIDTSPQARQALKGREIAWLADPIDAMLLHIQGSGRLRITEPDGRVRTVRLAFAGSNEHPYRSVGSWLLQQGLVRDASWPGIKAWAQRNPQRLNEMLWTNPRYVFFREEPISPADEADGPRGAQGVPLTAGRSIAVDPQSIPYGTPVWLASPGPTVALQRLVLAQDTGAAIVGAVRADSGA